MPEKKSYLPVLMYHRIVKSKKETGKHNIYVTEKRFRKQMIWLKKKQLSTITFREIAENPAISFENKIILTFDDGYVDNYSLLFPILKEFGFTAVVFLVTQQKNNSWGVKEGEPSIDLLTNGQILEMDQYGIEFGSHTQNHVNLHLCDKNTLHQEIAGSRKEIEALLNKKVVSFCYPFGGVNEDIKRIVKEAGYTFGISTNTGPLNFYDDLFQIRRIEVSCRTLLYRFKKKAGGNYYKK